MPRAFIVAAAVALLVGCTHEPVPINENPDRPKDMDEGYEKAQEPRVQQSFDRMQTAIVNGDTKAYFELLSRLQQASYNGYDAFLRSYAGEGNGWREMWRGAKVKQIAVEKDRASLLIHWSAPGPRLTEWVLEDGTWRLDQVWFK